MGILERRRNLQIARSFALIGGTAAIVIGATYAQTQVGSASLTGNTFSAGAGGIQIAADNAGSPGTYSGSITGFNFGQLAPGGSASSMQHFWLKDTAGSNISVTVAASNLSGFTNLNTADAVVNFERTGTATVNSAPLSTLATTSKTISNPPTTADTNGVEYNVWITLASGAISSGTSTSGSFDLGFTGTATP